MRRSQKGNAFQNVILHPGMNISEGKRKCKKQNEKFKKQ